MILALNTAQREHEMALLNGDAILAEEKWVSSRDDVETLVPRLEAMLEGLGLDKSEIHDIVVVNGPGPYTAVRMGVSFANALSEGLQAQLHSISTFDLMVKKLATTDKVLALLFAGGLDAAVYHEGDVQLGSLSTILAKHSHGDTKVVAELNEAQSIELKGICLEKGWQEVEGHERSSMAEVILTFGLKAAQAVDLADAQYLRSPKITQSANPWKKP